MFLQQRELTWPLWCIVACLLVLSVTVPRTRHRIAREPSTEDVLVGPSDRLPHEQVDALVDSTQSLLAPAPLGVSVPGSLPTDPWSDSLPDAPVLAEVGPQIGELRWPVLSELPEVAKGGKEAGDEVSPFDVRTLDPPPLLANAPSLVERIPPSQAPSAGQLRWPQQRPKLPTATNRQRIVWKEPSALLAQLEDLAGPGREGAWAEAVAAAVRELGAGVSTGNVREALAHLDALSAEANAVLEGLDDARSPRMRAAAGALRRRLQVWNQMSSLGWPEMIAIQPPPPSPEHLALAVEKVASVTGEAANGRAWSEYLMLDALRKASASPAAADADRKRLARQVVLRVLGTTLTPNQHRFLRSEPLTNLGSELRRWATEPIHLGEVLEHLEQYEQTSLPSDARRVVADCQALGISMIDGQQQLSDTLETRYRGANVRVTVTGELLNRLMPKREPEYASVSDTILGNPVHGSSRTETSVVVRMVPDPKRARLSLEVTGDVSSLTSSTSGPATFFSNSHSTYEAQKQIEVGIWGLQLWPAEVSVENVTRLRALRTQFDVIPVVGSLVQSLARSRHDQSMPAMRREVETKVAQRAKQRVDSEADARLGALSDQLEDRILKPLSDLSVKAVMVDAQTTSERFTMQLRLAGDGQLGGHTPRPQAPSDSLTSFQIHQSALNNFLEGLALDGRTFTTAQLRQYLAERLHRPEILAREVRHEDVTITFAPSDAVSLRCDDGRVAVMLAIARLQKAPRTWRDFQIRVFYRPQVDGLSVQLVRDGVVQLIGRRLDTSDQVALRGIFSKVFAKNHVQQATPEAMLKDPRLAGLAVTQCELRDGWIGVALGPQRQTDNSLTAKRESPLGR